MWKRTMLALAATAALCGCAGDEAASDASSAKPAIGAFENERAAETWSSSPGLATPAGPATPGTLRGTSMSELAAPPSPRTASPAATAGTPTRTTSNQPAPPTIPAGARFTIFCESFSRPDHVEYATRLKNVLQANSKLKDWYVIHQVGQSSLYHGYYAEFNADAAGVDKAIKRDADRAQRDHALVGSIPNPTATERKLFPRSLFVPLDAPDPDAPPAWNLVNAPGFWSVQIAAFTGAERKAATVESVKAARAMNVPAFYFHGANISSVCVGSWPRGAVKEQDVARAGNVDQDRNARDDRDLVIDYTGSDLSSILKQARGPDGKELRVLQAKIDIVDPTLLNTFKQYPEHAVDGVVTMIEGKRGDQKVTFPRPSMLVRIPRDGAVAPTVVAGDADPSGPAPGRQNLNERLRGLGQ